MFKNYLKIAWRNMVKHKANSLINILGLATGLTCVILVALYIKDELNYDRFFTDARQVYRVNIDGKMGDNSFYAGYTPPPAGKTLVENFPEIESYTRIYRPGTDVLEYQDGNQKRFFNESGIYAVDENFLEVLTYPLAKGNAKTCLQKNNSLVISPAIAKKYFGDTDPMGKTLLYGSKKTPLTVTGVLADMSNLPASVKFDMLTPIKNYADVTYFDWSWVWLNIATYVKLNKSAAENPNIAEQLEAKFPEMLRVQAAAAFDRIGQPMDEFLKKGNKWNMKLQPLSDIHLHSGEIVSSITDQGDVKNLYIFGIIAAFIIILACVNFMNLATAQSVKRSKEIGIRKVLGSQRSQLIWQFLSEAILYTFIATLLAIVLGTLLLPFFNQLSAKNIPLDAIFNINMLLLIVGLSVITALLSGIYPAFYLTSFNPLMVLKGGNTTIFKRNFIRNELVVFQFVIAIALIICTLVVYSQINYTTNRNLGYDRENVLILDNAEKLGISEETFRQEVAALPKIKSATISSDMFSKSSFGDFYVPETTDPDEQIAKDIALNSYLVDDHFIKTLGLELLEGRRFDTNFNDSLSVLLNETAAKQIGWKNPIGQYIQYPGGDYQKFKVVGILKDYNIESLHSSIAPFALFSQSSKSYDTEISYITLKLSAGNPENVINKIKTKWHEYQPDVPFEYSFLDEALNSAYAADQRTAGLFGVFTSLSIFVACLGLFGLVAFTAQQRSKEIGIRKVLGSSVTGIVKLMSLEFVKSVIIALLIASPIAWYFMHNWLQDFAYRISIEWWVFAVAGFVTLLIALITVSFQAIKAAIVNPVKSLRTE
ncbi:MAG TPA: ABC transporter permease [Leeuwenhoekiella sp.]|nr:ABC transporter permease [Leeuwenhoekiella sp.]